MEALPAELHGMDAGLAEQRLWAEALRLLLHDGRHYWRSQSGKGLNPASFVLEAAFDDVCRCGPMLRYLCDHLDTDADWISEQFIKWCEEAG